ncbi:MAG: hypothetical protein WDN49_04950 [Acetobacteraceae bacterium]
MSPSAATPLPAEELVRIEPGADYGWPECYFDDTQQKLVLAPEYGGDGGRKIGVCAQKQAPVSVLPRALGAQRHENLHRVAVSGGYRGGAFIAFHGSWNRAPAPQGGYNIVFQPLADGKPLAPSSCLPTGSPAR